MAKQTKSIVITDDADLGVLLRSMIDESGISRYAIMQVTGITEASLSRMYNGGASTTLATLAKVAKFIGYRVTVEIKKV